MYKPPQTGNAKTPPLNRPQGARTWKITFKYKVKQSQNGKFTSNYKDSPIDFETQIFLRRKAPPNISPSKNKPLKKAL